MYLDLRAWANGPFNQRVIGAALLYLSMSSAAADTFRFGLVSREAVEARLGEYRGDNSERQATLKRLFVEAGCGEHLSEQQVRGSRVPNLICTLPGSSGRAIIVGAHFDRVSAGDGVADNWSGASLLPSLYQAMGTEPRQHTYIFIGFTDEEIGLRGSRFYARQMTPEQIAATDAMVNMDVLGLAPPNVWASRSDTRLTAALRYVGTLLDVPVSAVNFERVGTTDSESFARRKIPRITVHSITQENHDAGILHSRKDNFSVIRLDDYYMTYRLLAAYLVFVDQLAPPETSTAAGP
jgi:putative aminopeptidase FrvX